MTRMRRDGRRESAVEREVAGWQASRLIASTLSRAKREKNKKKKSEKDATQMNDRWRIVVNGGTKVSVERCTLLTVVDREKWEWTEELDYHCVTQLDSFRRLGRLMLGPFQPLQSSLVVAFARVIRSQPCLRDLVGLAQDWPIDENGAIFSNPCSKTVDKLLFGKFRPKKKPRDIFSIFF